MRNIELPVLRRHGKHAIAGKKRLRRVPVITAITAITAAAVTASLIAAAGPASTAARPPTAPIISVSGNGRPAVALRAVLNRVRKTGDGQFALDSGELSSRARTADSAFVADLDKVERQAGALDLAGDNVVETADTIPAADQGTTVITILPGVTLTISSTTVVLDISSQDVTDILDVAALGSAIAGLVGAILSVSGVPLGGAISGIVASAISIGSDALKICSANDGGSLILSVSAPAGELPSVSACGITI
jgi:hypothetical protein